MMDSNLGEPGKDINICLKFCLKYVCYVAYPRSAQTYGDAMDSNLGEPGKDINICLKNSVPSPTFELQHVAYPRSAQTYGDAMDSNLGEPGKDINICLTFCLKMLHIVMCHHIPEALMLHTLVMPWTPTWVNQEKISTFV